MMLGQFDRLSRQIDNLRTLKMEALSSVALEGACVLVKSQNQMKDTSALRATFRTADRDGLLWALQYGTRSWVKLFIKEVSYIYYIIFVFVHTHTHTHTHKHTLTHSHTRTHTLACSLLEY